MLQGRKQIRNVSMEKNKQNVSIKKTWSLPMKPPLPPNQYE